MESEESTVEERRKRPKTGGRTAGTPNKVTKQLKDMILTALDNAGGVKYLTAQAAENPKTFLLLLGRVLPLQVTGEDGAPVAMTISWARSAAEATSDPSSK